MSGEVAAVVTASNDAPGGKAAQQATNQLHAVVAAEQAKLEALRAMRARLAADARGAEQAEEAAADALRRGEQQGMRKAAPATPRRGRRPRRQRQVNVNPYHKKDEPMNTLNGIKTKTTRRRLAALALAAAATLGPAAPTYALFGVADVVFDPANFAQHLAILAKHLEAASTAQGAGGADGQDVGALGLHAAR